MDNLAASAPGANHIVLAEKVAWKFVRVATRAVFRGQGSLPISFRFRNPSTSDSVELQTLHPPR